MQTSWQALWNEAKELAGEFTGYERIILSAPTIASGLKTLLAAIAAKKVVIFDEKGAFIASPTDFVFKSPDKAPALFSLSGPVPSEIWDLIEGKFTFATSGSTGESQLIEKHAEGLKNEVFALARLYEIQSGDVVCSLVRPFHIYGFLHSFLLPLFVGTEVHHWDSTLALPSLDGGFPYQSDLIITVPSHYNLMTLVWEFAFTRSVVSSGAPLGQEREKNIAEAPARRFERYWEILGSTETGGIAYRRVDQRQLFRPFPKIRMETLEKGTRIYSPFLAPTESIISQDQLEITSEGDLIHKGRSDRIFKYGGSRYSLAEVEKALSAICSGQRVIVHFEEQKAIPQGGTLLAWIEGDVQEVRALFPKNLPCPKKITFLPIFPRDAQGKISLSSLKNL